MARCGCVSACSCIFSELVEGDCIDITVSGSGSAVDPYMVTADLVIDPAAGNQAVCGVNGLFVPETAVIVTDTSCINMSITGNGDTGTPYNISADPIISGSAENLLVCGGGGLLVDLFTVDSATVDFSGAGTAASPLTAAVIGSLHTHDGAGGGASLVIGGVAEGGATVPTATTAQSVAMGDFANAGTALGPIAIGSGTDATAAPSAIGLHAISIGSAPAGLTGPRASGSSSIAIGGGAAASAGASATGIDTIAIGRSAGTAGAASQTICIGSSTQANSGAGAIAIGSGVDSTRAANATAQGAIAIGACNAAAVDGARATSVTSVAIGGGDGATAGARAQGTNAIAIGLTSVTNGAYTIAIGSFSQATTNIHTIAIGSAPDATRAPLATGVAAIAIGSSSAGGVNGARAAGNHSVAIGGGLAGNPGASASLAGDVAIGNFSAATGSGATAVGQVATASATEATALGFTALASGTSSIAVGHATASSARSIAIGEFAQATTSTQTIAIGTGAGNTTSSPLANAQGAIAVGASNGAGILGARASGISSIAIGSGTAAAIGASATATDAVAIGRTSSATATAAVAIGAAAAATHANAVALGDGVATTATGQVNIGIKRLFQGTPTTAPADADVINSQASLWLDEASYDFLLAYKAKTSGGTVKTGGWNLGEWEAYTPTLDQGGVVTNTIAYSRQNRMGREITFEFNLTVTGTGTAANLVTVSIPFTAVAATGTVVGSAEIFDDSTGNFFAGVAYLASATTIAFRLGSGAVTAGMGAAGGGFVDALAADDTVSGAITFEATT